MGTLGERAGSLGTGRGSPGPCSQGPSGQMRCRRVLSTHLGPRVGQGRELCLGMELAGMGGLDMGVAGGLGTEDPCCCCLPFLVRPWGGELSPGTPIRAGSPQGAHQDAGDRQELAGRQEEEMPTPAADRPAPTGAVGSGTEERPWGRAETDPGRSQELPGRAGRVGGALPGSGNRPLGFSRRRRYFARGVTLLAR